MKMISYQKLEKGKPFERAGRKTIDLSPWRDMVARLPGGEAPFWVLIPARSQTQEVSA
jgi:hypothetical protein